MAKSSPDERLVYIALKNTFKGSEAQLRNQKKIRKHIVNHQHDTEVQGLIQAHNLDNVCNAAKTLPEAGIFESTLKAKIRFPEVFEVSPVQSAERVASEAEAVRSEVDAIKQAGEGHQDGSAKPHTQVDSLAEGKSKPTGNRSRKRHRVSTRLTREIWQTTSPLPLVPAIVPSHSRRRQCHLCTLCTCLLSPNIGCLSRFKLFLKKLVFVLAPE